MEVNITFLIQLFVFLILLFWLSHFLFKPLLSLLNKREESIDGMRISAEKASTKAEKYKENINILINETKNTVNKEIRDLNELNQKEADDIVEDTKKEIFKSLEKSKVTLSLKIDKIRTSLKNDVPELSSLILNKILNNNK